MHAPKELGVEGERLVNGDNGNDRSGDCMLTNPVAAGLLTADGEGDGDGGSNG